MCWNKRLPLCAHRNTHTHYNSLHHVFLEAVHNMLFLPLLPYTMVSANGEYYTQRMLYVRTKRAPLAHTHQTNGKQAKTHFGVQPYVLCGVKYTRMYASYVYSTRVYVYKKQHDKRDGKKLFRVCWLVDVWMLLRNTTFISCYGKFQVFCVS